MARHRRFFALCWWDIHMRLDFVCIFLVFFVFVMLRLCHSWKKYFLCHWLWILLIYKSPKHHEKVGLVLSNMPAVVYRDLNESQRVWPRWPVSKLPTCQNKVPHSQPRVHHSQPRHHIGIQNREAFDVVMTHCVSIAVHPTLPKLVRVDPWWVSYVAFLWYRCWCQWISVPAASVGKAHALRPRHNLQLPSWTLVYASSCCPPMLQVHWSLSLVWFLDTIDAKVNQDVTWTLSLFSPPELNPISVLPSWATLPASLLHCDISPILFTHLPGLVSSKHECHNVFRRS